MLLRQALPMGLGSALNSIGSRIDVALLLHFSGAAEVGLYSAAYRISGAINNIPVALAAAVLPFFSRHSWKTPEMEELVERTLLAAVSTAGLILIFFAVAGPRLLVWLFGPSYESSADLLQILIWAIFPAFANVVLLHASVSQKVTAAAYTTAAGTGAAANILLNLWWIPLWKARAAAYATVATELAVCLTYAFLLHQVFGLPTRRRIVTAALFGLAMAATATALSLEGLGLGILASLAYFAILLGSGTVSKSDWRFWKGQVVPSPARK